ncbi:hypothetical protein JQX13_42885 [Archangium violaceum]|uniref:hypothetical protein n=1 Tax=Archangium violaceum TaxID=83451 RepID=UPI00193C777F|nr:hypothetical protein [Archangium violaceum]QRK06749.1 hypothetical protein JQX13_42885 [Archangium violaceum]
MSIPSEVEHFLRTGDYDVHCTAWPGDVLERERRAHGELRQALVMEVQRRTAGLDVPEKLQGLDVVALTRRKVEPMVRGLFPRAEQEAVLAVLERSVVFLTPANMSQVLAESSWLSTAWDLANLYLLSVGAELLGEDAPRLLGLSEHTTCYVSLAYFEEESPFADFLVHEAAHVFHNCKRRTVGLPGTRRREWLLDIDFRKRETFAYACEAYSRILEAGRSPRERMALAEEYAACAAPADERVSVAEVVELVREAAAARNGWKRILTRCAPAVRDVTRVAVGGGLSISR